MRGYRGFWRELGGTGSWRAFWLQLRAGVRHMARRALGRGELADPEALFLRSYADDGLRPHAPDRSALQRAAEPCLVCGLCSEACARAGGAPALDPRDAVLAGARLAIDVRRLALADTGHGCSACRACEPACPVHIPIAAIQSSLEAGAEEGGREEGGRS